MEGELGFGEQQAWLHAPEPHLLPVRSRACRPTVDLRVFTCKMGAGLSLLRGTVRSKQVHFERSALAGIKLPRSTAPQDLSGRPSGELRSFPYGVRKCRVRSENKSQNDQIPFRGQGPC